MKDYKFTITVKKATSRKDAERALLVCFASRNPDSREFHLHKSAPRKNKMVRWMAINP